MYNFAYGSNMDDAKLRGRRIGDGESIVPLAPGQPCRVPGWELSFDYIVLPPIEPVMAGAVRKDGAEMHGVLIKLTRAHYETLAKTEGCVSPSSIYVERPVLAYPYGEGSEPVEALVFALRTGREREIYLLK